MNKTAYFPLRMNLFVKQVQLFSFLSLIFSMSLAIASYGQAKQPPLTNKAILDMKANGVPYGLIIRRITEAPTVNFDLSDAAIGQLSKAGVSEEIINKMLDKQNAASTTGAGTTATVSGTGSISELKRLKSGIYIKQGERYVEIEPTIFLGKKESSRFLRDISYGFAKTTTRMQLNGKEANTSVPLKRPTFFFVFNPSENSLNNQESGWLRNVSNPGEFTLVKIFAINDKKSGERIAREVEVKAESYYAGRDEGINSKFIVDFKRNKLDEGIYEVYFDKELESGEYCFMYAGTNLEYRKQNQAKVYDFAVKQ